MDPVLHSAQARRDARLVGVPPGSAERYHVIAGVRSSALPNRVTVQMVKRAVCDLTPFDRSDLEGPFRFAGVARARQVAMYLSRQMVGASFPFIGYMFGKRDHTTVMHACREIPKRAQDSRELADFIEAVRARVAVLAEQVG